jgi:hypothetical protein
MDPELNRRLTVIEEKLEENYRVIKKIRKTQRNAALLRTGYWILIILVGFGAFYFIKPFMSQIGETYGFGKNNDLGNFSNVLQQFKDIQGE